MRRVRIVTPVNLPRTNDAQRWTLFLQRANLDRRGVCAQQQQVGNVERVLRIPCGMMFRNVQGFEVVERAFYFRAVFDGVAHETENFFNFAPYQRQGMHVSGGPAVSWQGYIHTLRLESRRESLRRRLF